MVVHHIIIVMGILTSIRILMTIPPQVDHTTFDYGTHARTVLSSKNWGRWSGNKVTGSKSANMMIFEFYSRFSPTFLLDFFMVLLHLFNQKGP